MAIGARPFYLFLTLFLFTQIVSVLWPKQHLFASRGTTYPSSWLSKRSLESLEPDIQCEDVWSHADRCAFVEQYCADYPAGLINYLHFYFCDLGKLPALAVVVLCVWMFFLFGFVGVAASDFFCPNLSTIAKQLHLSESMTGVTFLAFGNGSPDVFSTFSAIGAGSGSLAIGELVGAASFITSVVVGSMAIIKPFKVSRAPFLRDVSFFAGCVLFTLYAVLDGKITFLESLLLVAYYVFYVSFVVVGNWWHQRVKLERELEERARNMYEDDEADEGLQEDEPGVPDEERALLSGRSRTGAKLPNIVTQLVPGPYDAYEDEEHDDGGGAQDSISLRPPGTLSLKRRPSLISAMEFNDVVRSLTLSGSRGRIASYDPSYYGPKSPRSSRSSQHTSSRPRSFNTTMSHGYRPASPHSYASTPQNGYLSPRGADDRAALSPSPLSMDSDEGTFDAHFEQALLRQSLILPDHHSPANHHLGHIHNPGPLASPGGVSTPTDVATIAMPTTKTERFIDLLKALKPIYFPTLLDWDNKSAFVRFLAITSVPMVLLLTLTLPVVELRDDEDESADELNNTNPTTGPPKIIIGEIEDEDCQYEGWSRTATTTQMLIAPVFIAAVLTSAAQEGYIAIPAALGLGIILSFLVRRFSSEEQPPRGYGAFCFIGFLVAITWIFLVANEVVGILQAFGMIFGVSDAILGLTIFAMGNSLGDLVANITIAKMGFPRMAFSACFGGPLLNMLLGVGISGTYMTVKTGTYIPLEVSPTLFVSLIGVLLTLCTAMIYIPRNGYMMTRSWGWFLLIVYTTCTVANVIIEIATSREDH
ncbi:Sodium/calcium exchanger protein-domain-containing protein [Gamsiella multidivaricata]|uniref:Sodium/calcium exchanger protein-domain-containing protein n=1 Tax=Gamsiella multidivaricata TaxID=101098 RepID=UPI00221EE149|nr:Sodium/calcium exchanger protein-domain-containing protein [Gamsiella multidivaricata]KAI7832253.1 Sodium/calcium exchanger protein-domain-containing protein [Gamsiella multidivaricata]